MADLKPENFPQPPSSDVRSFSSADMISGVAYITLYAGQSNGTPSLGLNVLQFYSDLVTFKTGTFTASVGSDTKVVDRDYDVLFNQATILEGLCIVNVPWAIQNVTSNGQNHTGFVVVKLRKFDGTTETEIASATGRTHNYGTMSVAEVRNTMDAMSMTISAVKINASDKLRLTIEIWHQCGGAVNTDVYLGQDPKNRAIGDDPDDQTNWGTNPTQLSLLLPVRYDN